MVISYFLTMSPSLTIINHYMINPFRNLPLKNKRVLMYHSQLLHIPLSIHGLAAWFSTPPGQVLCLKTYVVLCRAQSAKNADKKSVVFKSLVAYIQIISFNVYVHIHSVYLYIHIYICVQAVYYICIYRLNPWAHELRYFARTATWLINHPGGMWPPTLMAIDTWGNEFSNHGFFGYMFSLDRDFVNSTTNFPNLLSSKPT